MIERGVTTNLRLAAAPGNVGIPAGMAGLAHDSVINVTQVATVDRYDLLEVSALCRRGWPSRSTTGCGGCWTCSRVAIS